MKVINFKVFESSNRYELASGNFISDIEAELMAKRTKGFDHFLSKIKKNHYDNNDIPDGDISILRELYSKSKN